MSMTDDRTVVEGPADELDDDTITYPPTRRQRRAEKRARKGAYRKAYRAQARDERIRRAAAWNDPEKRARMDELALARYRELVDSGIHPSQAARIVKKELSA